MQPSLLLQDYLASWTQGSSEREIIQSLISAIANAGIRLSRLIVTRELYPLAASDALTGVDNPSDEPMDMVAHKLFSAALAGLPVSALISADRDGPQLIDPQGRYLVAICRLARFSPSSRATAAISRDHAPASGSRQPAFFITGRKPGWC